MANHKSTAVHNHFFACEEGPMRVLLEPVTQPRAGLGGTVDLKPHSISVLGGLRVDIRSRWPEWITIASYAVVIAFAIPYHEPWVDEAQAWQLARSLPLVALFQKYIRYEGSPGLWHFLLWILNRAHVSYTGMHWICGAIATGAVSVFVLNSPFPRYLKFSLPFTYFLLFQYAVIARNYVLVPWLLFMIASRWKRSPIVIALLLGLLANVALHTAVISGGLAIVYAIERIGHGDSKEWDQRRELLLSAAMLVCFYAFALWTAWPPHDLVLARVRGPSRSFIPFAVASLVWGVCEPWLLSIPFWIAVTVCFWARRSLVYLLPVVFFACFSGAVYATWWHVGLVIPLVICLLWITWPAPVCGVSRYEAIGRAAMIFMAGTQILWSAYALAYDHSHAYSPDLAASKFLQPFVREGSTIAVTYLDEPWIHGFRSVGILPYFSHNIYINEPNSFWSWSANDQTENLFDAALRTEPRIVLVEISQSHPGQSINLEHPKLQSLIKAGYRLTNVFCGAHPERFELVGGSCHLIFQHFGGAQDSLANP
jgi:hypothetical protein